VKPLTLVAARRWWPLALGVLLGALAGLLVSLLGSGVRRAEASVLISSPAGPAAVTPMLPNLRELAKSGVVAGNVQSTLRLTKSTRDLRRQLHATVRPQSEVIAISVTDERADHARQIAQEAAVVFAQLVDARFAPDAAALGAHRQVLLDGEIGEDAPVLRHVPDPESADLVGGTPGDLLPVEADGAAGHLDQAHDGLERGRLARAVAPQQPEPLAGIDLEARRLEQRGAGEPEAHIVETEQRHGVDRLLGVRAAGVRGAVAGPASGSRA